MEILAGFISKASTKKLNSTVLFCMTQYGACNWLVIQKKGECSKSDASQYSCPIRQIPSLGLRKLQKYAKI